MSKRFTLVLALLFSVSLSFSQDEDEEINYDSIPGAGPLKEFPFEVFYGKKFYQNTFYDQLCTTGNYSLKMPLNMLGLGYTGAFVVSREYFYAGHIAFLYILPQKIVVDTSTNGKITGFIFSFSGAGIDLFPKKNSFDLIVSVGANLGRLRLTKNSVLNQKNPIVAPMISVAPVFKIRKLKLGFNFQYDYDVSKTGWKKSAFPKGSKFPLINFNQSGFSSFISVGRVLE